MRRLVKLTFPLLLIAVVGVNIRAQQDSRLVGSYFYRFEWGGGRITLKNNGTFTRESGDCTGVTIESGPYSVSNNAIRFTSRKLTMRSFSDNKERDLTKRKERKKYLDTDEPFKPESWELQIVRWDERVYLLDRTAFGSFIQAINLGFEPRSVDGYRAYYGAIFLREGDENKPVTGPPALPEGHLRDLLPAPVIATVLELKGEGGITVATIDRGNADGLKKEMALVPITPTMFYQPYRISSIGEHSAQVNVSGDIKVGDQLTTRVSDVLSYAE